MSKKPFEFKRKNNYQNEVIDWIKSKRQSHSGFLFILNENCIMKIFNQLPSDELEKILYSRCETADEVILDNWKPVANSGLKKTMAVKS